jgi:hypothetical protein
LPLLSENPVIETASRAGVGPIAGSKLCGTTERITHRFVRHARGYNPNT